MYSLRDIIRPGLTGTVRWPRAKAAIEPHGAEVIKAWKKACHEHARAAGGEVGAVRPAAMARNYHSIEIKGRERGRSESACEVLLHALLPFVGARSVEPRRGVWRYVDPRAFPTPEGLMLLPAELLNKPFEREAWMKDQMDPAAWKDTLHWRPDLIGDLVFNEYD